MISGVMTTNESHLNPARLCPHPRNIKILCCFSDVMTELNLTMRTTYSFTECIRAKFGDKVLERSRLEIRKRINQKSAWTSAWTN